ncbi:thiamine diphosphokinase [Allorhizobium sp. BGMRC 0089]|uniref:thiamine diphosphokinase n=1 Tax=Allorhizobium sonneratiae TaxID=2934936 RepID=UPI0020345556|nr:thiamine diphosphokinase [Allorhizobium sonneratiae]MCM2293449.1 thiamine diphosphokinase [Allorhizobium sonneratiae]
MTVSDFTILLGGPIEPTERLKTAVDASRSIAADGGMRHAAMLSLKPELWVGDFDSSADLPLDAAPDVPRQPYPAQKNLTDGEIAIEEALKRGASRLILVGALAGERSDHALMHLLIALSLSRQGIHVALSSGWEEAWPLVPGRSLTLDLPQGSLFSVLGFSALTGLSIQGARYPLDGFDLPFGSSRTISNVAEGPVTVSLMSGDAILLARPYDFTGA